MAMFHRNTPEIHAEKWDGSNLSAIKEVIGSYLWAYSDVSGLTLYDALGAQKVHKGDYVTRCGVGIVSIIPGTEFELSYKRVGGAA